MAQAYRLSITLEPVDSRAQVRTGEAFSRVRLQTLPCESLEAFEQFEGAVAYLAHNLTREVVRDAMAEKRKA